jgi:hypothetical protein
MIPVFGSRGNPATTGAVRGGQEHPAQGLQAGGPPGPEDAGHDRAEAEPAERGERQQVGQPVGTRMQDSPQREQQQHGGCGRDQQMPPEPELGAELGAERADGGDVHREVDQHHREAARAGQVAERAHPAVAEGQRQPEQEREPGHAADRDGRRAAAGQPGQGPG